MNDLMIESIISLAIAIGTILVATPHAHPRSCHFAAFHVDLVAALFQHSRMDAHISARVRLGLGLN